MKSRRSTTASAGGIGLLDVILIVNIILKLFKVSTIATWTWVFDGQGNIESIIGGWSDVLDYYKRIGKDESNKAVANKETKENNSKSVQRSDSKAPKTETKTKLSFTQKHELEELPSKVEALEEELVLLREEEYELSKLQELYDVDNQYRDYEKTGANVIAKSTSAWFSTFTIDKGEKDGIEVGMNVLASGGLCGIVSETSKNFSIVTSIVNDGNNVSASVLTTGDNCIVSGSLSKMTSDGTIEFSSLDDSKDAVSVGDMLVVSNISNKYIPGLIVGYITEINENPNKLTKSGELKPAVDFKHLTNVLVITTQKQTHD